MTRDIINVQYPTLDHTESVANIGITESTVTQANGVTIADAFSNKNNSLFIIIKNFNFISFIFGMYYFFIYFMECCGFIGFFRSNY